MKPTKRASTPSKKYPPGSFMGRLKERKIIATLAAFAGSGVVIIELAHHILVNHYHFPHQIVDFCIVTLAGALIGTLTWRWFRGTEKRPGNVKVEVLVVPLIILLTLVIDLKLIFVMTGISINMLLIGIVALCLGIAWVVFKSLQWAASAPEAEKKVEVLKPMEEKPISFPEWKKSIAVLPFANISADPEQEYFCDGMTEEIITDLSSIHDLRVISRSSAMMLKGSKKAVRDIAKELNVQYMLEGSVRKAGNDIRITAQLIDATSDAHLWAEKYSVKLDDVFDIQEKVSRSIVDALKLKLSPEEVRGIAEHAIDNAQAYEWYIRARQEFWKYTEDSLNRCLQYLKNGETIVGDNALLLAGIGFVYFQFYDSGIRLETEYIQNAESYGKKALHLNSDSPHAHRLLGLVQLKKTGSTEAYGYIKKAHQLDPNDPDTLFWLVYILSLIKGRISESEPYVRKLLSIDPLIPANQGAVAGWHLAQGELEQSLSHFRKWYHMEPDSSVGRWHLAVNLALNQKQEESISLIEQTDKDIPGAPMNTFGLILKCAIKGKKESIKELLTDEITQMAWNDFHLPWFMAQCFALLNQKSRALDWLEQAVEQGWTNYPLFSTYDPFLENIRGESRFKKLMKRAKHEWENFEV